MTFYNYSFKPNTPIYDSPKSRGVIGHISERNNLVLLRKELAFVYMPVSGKYFSLRQDGYVVRDNFIFKGKRKVSRKHSISYLASNGGSYGKDASEKRYSYNFSNIYVGPRGGKYIYNSKGNKVYLSSIKSRQTSKYRGRSYSSHRRR